MSSERRRSGVSGNAHLFSSMTDEQVICYRLSKPTGAPGSEANKVIDSFNKLKLPRERQDVVNFCVRSR